MTRQLLAQPAQDAPEASSGGGAPAAEAGFTLDPTASVSLPPDEPSRSADSDDEDDDSALVEHLSNLATLPEPERPKAERDAYKDTLKRQRKTIKRLQQKATLYERISTHPKLGQLIERLARGEDIDLPAPGAAPRATQSSTPADDLDFDPENPPFDPKDSEANAWLAKAALAAARSRRELAELRATVQALQQSRQQEQTQSDERQWQDAITAAASKIPHEGVRATFVDAVIGGYQTIRARGIQGVKPEQVIGFYLKKLGLGTETTRRAQAAAAERMATSNQSRPAAAFVGGSPSAATDRAHERISDVHKRVMARFRQQG